MSIVSSDIPAGRFSIATLGCKVNQFETGDMVEQLQAAGWHQVSFGEPADLCLINSCTVTSRSDTETRRLVRRARRANPSARVVVTGCYAQVAPQELIRLPEVDQVLGNEEKHEITRHLSQGCHQVSDLKQVTANRSLRLTSFAEHTRAFLQVQNGCEAGCAYCIVPEARGPSRSVAVEEILATAGRLAANGYQELVLTGIHLGAYGLELTPRSSLINLVQLLEQQAAMPRLRLGSIEPTELTNELIELFKTSTRLCPHLHIPLQSGSDTVLQRMGRQYTTKLYRNRIEAAVQALPDAFIAADLIAGFPGETEQEFNDTCTFLASLPIADLHVFPYSIRPGTRAATMPGHLHPRIIKERAETLRNLAAEKRHTFQQRFIGTLLPVLGQRYNPLTGQVSGLSRNYLEVICSGSAELLNKERMIQIESVANGQLYGHHHPDTDQNEVLHVQD